ncbi:hypothetical protein DL98DRAFT_578808 [Cadophora sp. DSE1049]|nr:hypothetical protein DL98DRAFT_578808 [Cadophora sp. DSE1049]
MTFSSFCFDELAPASVSIESGSQYSQEMHDSFGVLTRSLAIRHSDQILNSHPWTCIVCHKPAKVLTFRSTYNLYKHTIGSRAEFSPSIIDIAVPVCFSGGFCTSKADEIPKSDESLHRWAGKPMTLPSLDTTLCQNCGKTGLQVCNGCRNTWYCSKECQVKQWPGHKKDCKRAQKEREEAAAANGAGDGSNS